MIAAVKKTSVMTLVAAFAALTLAWPAATSNQPADATTGASAAYSSNGLPLRGQTLFGAGVMGDIEPMEAQMGGTVGIRRSYFSASQQQSAVNRAQSDLAAGRLPWVSFKAPFSWSEMAAGKGDAWARDIANRLATVGGPVWVAVEHEPEGAGSVADWRAMQMRLGPIFKAKPNIAFSIILMGWYQFFSGQTKYSMEAFWPGKENIDIVAFDPYNWYETTSKSGTKKYTWDELKRYYDAITVWLQRTGNSSVRWAVAETGYTDAAAKVGANHKAPDGRTVSTRGPGAEWLTRAYDDMKSMGGIALSYFNISAAENGEPSDWTWPVSREPKLSIYRNILSRSDRIHDGESETSQQVTFSGSTSTRVNSLGAQAGVPSTVKAGDNLLMFVSLNTEVGVKTPAGWTLVGSRASGGMRTHLFRRTASAVDAESLVNVTFEGQSKADVTVLAHSGASTSQPISAWASASETQSSRSHLTPSLGFLPEGANIVSYWADKSSSTTGWVSPAGGTQRIVSIGSGNGRITALAADSPRPLGGSWTGLAAEASSASSKATMWSVALAP